MNLKATCVSEENRWKNNSYWCTSGQVVYNCYHFKGNVIIIYIGLSSLLRKEKREHYKILQQQLCSRAQKWNILDHFIHDLQASLSVVEKEKQHSEICFPRLKILKRLMCLGSL